MLRDPISASIRKAFPAGLQQQKVTMSRRFMKRGIGSIQLRNPASRGRRNNFVVGARDNENGAPNPCAFHRDRTARIEHPEEKLKEGAA